MYLDSQNVQASNDAWEGVVAAEQQRTTAFLAIPSIASAVPTEVHMLGAGGADPFRYAAAIDLLSDSRYDRCNSLGAIASELTAHLRDLLTIEHSSKLRFLVTLRPVADVTGLDQQPAGSYTWYGTKKDIKPDQEANGIAVCVSIVECTGGKAPLKPALDAWNSVDPNAEQYIASVLRSMNATPYILTPFDIQSMYSEYIFELGEQDEDFGGEVDSTYSRKALETIPEVWRHQNVASTATQANHNAQQNVEAPALRNSRSPEISQLLAAGDRVKALHDSTVGQESWRLTSYGDRAMEDVFYVLYHRAGDFLEAHFDHAFEDVMNSGEIANEALVAVIKDDRATFDALVHELRGLFTYVDACIAFIDLILSKD
ncbi:MAG: hypothetical protein LW865_11285 [Betaproteobacteria bacterium]|nr:hypothetical protein [Betaproteobacteria bacterium]